MLQHLKEALDCAYGEGTAEAMHRFETLRETLKESPDGIDKVLRSLRYLSGSTRAGRPSPASSPSSEGNGIE